MIVLKLTSAVTLLKLMDNPLLKKAQFTFYKTNLITTQTTTHTHTMNTQNTTHNGWTNYATWRVNLEVFDGHDSTDGLMVTAEDCKAYATDLIEGESESGLALDYALAFLAEVNWSEIAESINETI